MPHVQRSPPPPALGTGHFWTTLPTLRKVGCGTELNTPPPPAGGFLGDTYLFYLNNLILA